MKIKNIGSKTLSVILAILMIMYSIPLMSVASLLTSEDDTMLGQEINTEDNVIEITELREEDIKHFRLADGTYIAAQYKTAVHYLDDNGMWQDIDNSLSEIDGDISTSNSRVKFSKKITGNEHIFTLKNGSYKITFSLEDAAKGTPITVSNDGKTTVKAATKFEELSTLSKITSSVRYNEILPGVDLEYVLLGSEIKENIIVNEKQDEYVFKFGLSLNGLIASLEDDGSVSIWNEDDEKIFTLPAPYMYDGAMEFSESVSYSLSTTGNGKYVLTVTADENWINSEDRVFPVTIDPTLDDYENFTVTDTYQHSKNETTSYISSPNMYIGNRNGYTQYTLIMFNSIPSLPIGSTVTNFSLSLDATTKSIDASVTRRMEARKVTSSHSSLSGITWNTAVSYSSDIYDYINITNDSKDFYTLDLTRMYHEWVENNESSRIVRLSLEENDKSDYVIFATMDNTSTSVIKPLASLTYINTIGIEDQLSYKTQSVGDAGTVYISDLNGQITLARTDAVSDNSALSTSVGHVYNSVFTDTNYSIIDRSNSTNMFDKMKTGNGFMLSVQQTLQATTIDGTHYAIFTDSDGTVHYIPAYYADGTTIYYKDTEGMGLYLYDPSSALFASDYKIFADLGFTSANSLLMEDPEGNCMLFYNGLPAVFADLNGNLVKYLYNTTSSAGTAWFPKSSGNQLRAIVQNNRTLDKNGNAIYTEDIVVATLNYNSAYYLTSIVSPGRTLAFSYDSSHYLTKVSVSEYLNSKTTATTYDLAQYGYTDGILTDVYDVERQYGVHYDFTDGKCSSYYEFAGTISSHTVGGHYDIAYKPGQTTYTFANVNNGSNSGKFEDDIITVNVYDYYGRTICSYTKDGLGNVIGATAGSYVESNDFSNNSIADSSSVGITVSNLLPNSSFEASTPLSGWTTTNGTITYDTEYVRTGLNSAKMTSSSSTATAMRLSRSVTVPSSGKYYFSVYVNTSALSAAEGGVYLQVVDLNGSVALSKVYNGNIGYSDSSSNSTLVSDTDQWQRIGVAFTASSGKQYSLRILAKKIVGDLYLDDVQLEKSSVMCEYNYLNANESGTGGRTGWTLSSKATSYTDDSFGVVDCYEIDGTMDNTIHLSQTVNINNVGKGFTVSGWAKANSVPINGNERRFGLSVTISYIDSPILEEVYISFNSSNTNWQYISGTVLPSRNNEIWCITVDFDYTNNCNTAYVAGISLVESDAVGYTYNASGYLTSTNKAGLEKSVYTYTGTKLTSFANGSISADIEYTEEQNGQLPSTVTTGGITTEYTYDRAGNVIGTVVRPEGSTITSLSMTTSSTFDSKLAKLQASTNELGTVASYTYNTDGSVKTSTLDGVETEYLYGKKGRQSQATIDGLANAFYSYSKGNLSGITVGGIESSGTLLSYSLSYDAFGRTTSIKAMNQTLVTYTYQNATGLLLTATYGNGFSISYTYDNLGRTTLVKYNGTDAYSYTYDGRGNLSEFNDHVNGVVYQYDYDSNGNLLSDEQYSTADVYIQGQYYSYDSYGNLKSSAVTAPGTGTIRYVCTYNNTKQNVREWKAKGSEYRVEYLYDSLNRPTSQLLCYDLAPGVSSPYQLTRKYSYLTNSSGNATSLISGLTYSGKVNASYSYSYDKLGNITAVYKGTSLVASYEYDDLGQLVRENNEEANKTWIYTYDDRGNITARKTYNECKDVETSSLGTPDSIDSYTYYQQWDTDMWGDGLKSYNGSATFTYDAIGNPLTYNNGSAYTFTWQNGRRLASGTKGSTSFAYTYNSDGLRTRKVVGSKTYDYYWFGSQLAMMTITSGSSVTTLKFYYDANGLPIIFDYNGTQYYYITNLQGDVVGLANEYGIVATYAYDAWGKIISTSGITSMEESALAANPIRYRGYIYDTETGFYYLQSRYYDPSIGRFITADGYVSMCQGLTIYNMYAYCATVTIAISSNITTKVNCLENAFVAKCIANAVFYSVPLYYQAKYSLCWAFSQIMIEDYQSGSISTNEQATDKAIQLANLVHGSEDWNRGGWPNNCTSYNASGVPIKLDNISSIDDLYYYLAQHGPMYAYYRRSSGGSAHLIVITGVDLTNGIVYTNNPWGIYGKQSYEDFLNGFAGGTKDGTYPLESYLPIK